MSKAQEQPKEPDPIDPADLEFEREIAAAHPRRKVITRFDFPEGADDAIAVYLLRLTGRDELIVAEMTDAIMTVDERKSAMRSIDAERREGVRYSIVGLVDLDPDSGKVRRRLIDQSRPFTEIDEWSSAAWACLRTWYGEQNGISNADLGKSVASARRIGGTNRATLTPVSLAR